MTPRHKRLALYLEELYERCNRRELVSPDPLQFLYRYEAPEDREIAALVASSLAYGRVATILKSVETVLGALAPWPWNKAAKRGGARRSRRSGTASPTEPTLRRCWTAPGASFPAGGASAAALSRPGGNAARSRARSISSSPHWKTAAPAACCAVRSAVAPASGIF